MARWYIIHAYSGFENKVRDSVLSEAERMGLTDFVEAVEVPVETVTEVKRGKKVQAERKFFPGYVLAKLTMTDDVYHLVKNTPKVTGFLGSMGKPQAISEAEAARILNSKEEAAARPKLEIRVDYEIGDQVKVLDGPFASFNGLVEELDFEKARVGVDLRSRHSGRTRFRTGRALQISAAPAIAGMAGQGVG
jgi:transcriptional antiterminator NusG